ncbi:MAG: Major Facilitator Superfamily [Frankiales bacterium]|nr:Major Facilitator Superfamily [Frankiales bacterium]
MQLGPHPRRESVAGPSAAAVAVATMTVLPLSLAGGLAVQLSADLGVPVTALGLTSAAFFGAATLMSPFAGAVVARIGSRAAMRLSVLLVSGVLVTVGLWVRSLPALLLVLAVGGAGNALAQPATNLFLAQRVAPSRQGTAYGIKQSAIPASSLIAGLSVPALGLTVGWRWAFVLLAVPAAVLAIRVPGGGHRDHWVPGDHRRRHRLPRKILLVIACGAGLAAACAGSLSIFLVAGAVEAGWGEAQAGLIFAGASVAGILARLGSGMQADRRGAGHLEVIALMLVLGAGGFACLASGNHILYALGAPVSFALGWGWPGLLILSVVQLSPADPAAATALTQVGTSAGAVLGPFGFGLLVEGFGYGVAFGAAGAGLAVAGGIMLTARGLSVPLPADEPDRLPPVVCSSASTHPEVHIRNNRDIVEKYFHACTHGDADAIAASFCQDAVVYDTNHRPVVGAADIGRFYVKVREQWAGASWHVDTFVGEGSAAAAEWTMLVPGEGTPSAVRGSEHYEFRDDRIQQIRQYWTYDADRLATGLRDYPYAEDDRFTKGAPV